MLWLSPTPCKFKTHMNLRINKPILHSSQEYAKLLKCTKVWLLLLYGWVGLFEAFYKELNNSIVISKAYNEESEGKKRGL